MQRPARHCNALRSISLLFFLGSGFSALELNVRRTSSTASLRHYDYPREEHHISDHFSPPFSLHRNDCLTEDAGGRWSGLSTVRFGRR